MAHPKTEKTLVIVKPDGIQRSLIGEIIQRYERLGLKLVGLKMCVPTVKQIEEHYTLDPNWRRVTGEKTIKSYKEKGLTPPSENPLDITAVILENLKRYMTSGPVMLICLEGENAIAKNRELMGATDPAQADAGTIRKLYAESKGANTVHGSDSAGSAARELAYFFGSAFEFVG